MAVRSSRDTSVSLTSVSLSSIIADGLAPDETIPQDPGGWITHVLHEHLWSKQTTVVESVRQHRRTAVHSCHGVGKSWTASRVAAWWLSIHAAGEAFVVSSAPTFAQVRAVLWREINKAHAKGTLPGKVNQTEWWIGNQMVGFGRKPSDVDPAAFQGIHARYVLVILDEACGIPKSLWDAASTLVTNADSRILAIGNPDDPDSYFAQVCRPGSGWNVIQIDGYDTPNFTGEDIPDDLRPLLISPVWVDEKREEWGESSPIYLSKVRGVFPTDADDGVVPYSAVAKCREPREHSEDALIPVELGVDVGAGGDSSVIRERRGRRAGRVWRNRQRDTMQVVGLTVQAIQETGAQRVKVDVIGIGKGVHDRLEELRREGTHQAEIVAVNVGERSTKPERFPRLRDQVWWEVGRDLSTSGGWDLSAVDDATVSQLVAPKYSLDSAGRIKVEQKDDTRERIGRSPDDADALLLAFYSPTSAGDWIAFMREQAAAVNNGR